MTTSLTRGTKRPHRKNPQLLAGSTVSIGRTFKNVRRELVLSQKTFAACLDVDYVWLSKLENDRLLITDDTETTVAALLPVLAEMIQVDIAWLEELPICFAVTGRVCPPLCDAAFTCYLGG